MSLYLKAFVGSFFLTEIAAATLAAIIWIVFTQMHAPTSWLITGEIAGLVPVALLFVVLFRHALRMERQHALADARSEG